MTFPQAFRMDPALGRDLLRILLLLQRRSKAPRTNDSLHVRLRKGRLLFFPPSDAHDGCYQWADRVLPCKTSFPGLDILCKPPLHFWAIHWARVASPFMGKGKHNKISFEPQILGMCAYYFLCSVLRNC